MDIRDLVRISGKVNGKTGWNDNESTFGDRIALVHTEASEALEQFRDGHDYRETYYTVDPEKNVLAEDVPPEERNLLPVRTLGDPHTPGCLCEEEYVGKPEGIPSELADILIRVSHMAYLYEIDLDFAVLQKLQYNATRSYRHGGKRI